MRCYLSFSVDHMSLDLVDRDFMPSPLIRFFEDNEEDIRMIVKGRGPSFEARCSWLFERINLVFPVLIRDVRTTEQVSEMLTPGAFATTRWKSLMRSIDIQPPPK